VDVSSVSVSIDRTVSVSDESVSTDSLQPTRPDSTVHRISNSAQSSTVCQILFGHSCTLLPLQRDFPGVHRESASTVSSKYVLLHPSDSAIRKTKTMTDARSECVLQKIAEAWRRFILSSISVEIVSQLNRKRASFFSGPTVAFRFVSDDNSPKRDEFENR
jgi:hypothetical protein